MSGYQERLQGKDRLIRIKRIRLVSLAAIGAVTVFFITAVMLDQGARFVPLFLPIVTPLEIVLVMGLLVTGLGMYLRYLELRNATSDSARYLMLKYSMNRARSTAGIAAALAALLLLPMSASVAGSLFAEAPRAISIQTGGTETVLFTSPDALGVSFARRVTVSVSSGSVNATVLRDNATVTTADVPTSGRAILRLDEGDVGRFANWSVVLRNTAARPTTLSFVLERGVMAAFFAMIPFLLILHAAMNLGWWIILRPIRERAKAGAVYGGGGVTQVAQDERLYVEYAQNPSRDVVPMDPPIAATAPPPPPPRAIPPPPPVPVHLAPAEGHRPSARPAPPKAENPESLVEKGSTLFSVGTFEPALVAFEEALRLNPNHLPALRGQANCLMRLGKAAEALDAYRKILTVRPRDEEVLKAVAGLLVAGREWREALEALDGVLRLRPNDRTILEMKGDVLTNLGRRAEALGTYESALALDPSNANVRQKIEEVRVDVPGLLSRALIASASGNYAAALNLFDDILEVDPGNVNALIGKAVAYRRSGKPREAVNCLDLVLNLQPGNVAALLNRGHILEEQGDLDAALETYDKLVSLAPSDEEAWTAQGNVLVKMGRDDDALRAYAEALKRNPGDEEILARIRELEEARSVQADVLQELYKVKGIGPAKAKALIDAGYRTAEDFAHANVEQLLGVRGITRKIAQDLVKHFKGSLVEAR